MAGKNRRPQRRKTTVRPSRTPGAYGSGALLIEPFANDPLVTAVRRDAVPERVGAVIRHVLAQFVGADHGAAGDSAIIQPQRGIVNDSTGVRRQVTARSRRVLPRCSRQPSTLYATSRVASRLPAATAVILASTVIAACGSGSPSNSSSSGSSGSNSSQTQLQQEALNFAALHALTRGIELPRPDPKRWRVQRQCPRDQSVLPGVQGRSDGLQAAAAGKATPVGTAIRARLYAAAPLGGVHARARDVWPSRPEARPASIAVQPLRHADGGRRVLGRDPNLDQRALARVYALVDGVRRVTQWPSQLGGVARSEEHPRVGDHQGHRSCNPDRRRTRSAIRRRQLRPVQEQPRPRESRCERDR